MAATRFLLAPLSGVFVATSLFYAFRHTMAVRTHDAALGLNDAKTRLDNLDPDNWDVEGRERMSQQELRPAYIPPQRLSLLDEVKLRWSRHLISAVETVSSANYYELVANGLTGGKDLVSKLGLSNVTSESAVSAIVPSLREASDSIHQAAKQVENTGSRLGSRAAQVLENGTSKVEAGKLRDVDRRQTHYLDEGASLR